MRCVSSANGWIRVLVVDDDGDFVRLMSRMLANPVRRYQVMGARSYQEALNALQESRPDLILLDLMLPDKSGLPNWYTRSSRPRSGMTSRS